MGRSLTLGQVARLERYREWLIAEAVPAGGLGPHEVERLDRRHLADSLLYAHFFSSSPPDLCDLGTGVGLPGVPLAIMLPETRCVLVDRSGRRARLLRRLVRVLDLDNVEVRQTEIGEIRDLFSVVVTRASLPAEKLGPVVWKLLGPEGVAVAGGSWLEPPATSGWDIAEITSRSLDRTVWFLIMRRQ